MTLHCGDCGREWTASTPPPCDLTEFIVWARAQRCHGCGADAAKLLCGPRPGGTRAS